MGKLGLLRVASVSCVVGLLAVACGGATFSEGSDDGGGEMDGEKMPDARMSRDTGHGGDDAKGGDDGSMHGDDGSTESGPSDSGGVPETGPEDARPPPKDAKSPDDAIGPKDANPPPKDSGPPHTDSGPPPKDSGPPPKDSGKPDVGGHDASGSCGSTAACATGYECAYLIMDACLAVPMCVQKPVPSGCGTIIEEMGCDCDGKTVTWTGGCVGEYPTGYAPDPIASSGSCVVPL